MGSVESCETHVSQFEVWKSVWIVNMGLWRKKHCSRWACTGFPHKFPLLLRTSKKNPFFLWKEETEESI
jgi:hypothetical protein